MDDVTIFKKSSFELWQESWDQDVLPWPLSPRGLYTLYRSCIEHQRAIHVKAEGAFGQGLEGDGAERLDELSGTGSADLFVNLGVDLGCFGNAFLELVRPDRQIIGLRWLPAITIRRLRRGGGYRQTITEPGSEPTHTDFAANEVLHLRTACPAGGHYATPTWSAAEGMIQLVDAATGYNADFFRNHALPEYAVLTWGPPLTADQKIQLKDYFQRNHQGIGNKHRAIHLHFPGRKEDQGIEFKELTRPHKDGEFLKLLDAARDRLPIAHGVPPRMMGIVSGGQLGGGGEVAAQLHVFERLTLEPMRRRVLAQLRGVLRDLGVAPAALHFVPLDLSSEPPSDLHKLVETGVLTAEQARALLHLEAEEGVENAAEGELTRALVHVLGRL